MTRRTKKPNFNLYMAHQDQYLWPEALYTLNRMLDEIQDELECQFDLSEDEVVVTPFVFNKKTRSFHFACVFGQGWGPQDPPFGKAQTSLSRFIDDDVDELISRLRSDTKNEGDGNTKTTVKDFEKAKCFLSNHRTFNKALDDISNFLSSSQRPIYSKQSSGEKASLIRCLHLIYFGFKSHRALYLPGILYRGLVEHARPHHISHFKASVEQSNLGDQRPQVYRGCYYDRFHDPIEGDVTLNQYEWNDNGSIHITHDDQKRARGASILVDLAELFYLRELNYMEEHDGVSLSGPVMLLPLYDVWLGGEGFGGLWGCLVCTFKNENILESAKHVILHELLPRCEALSDRLFEAELTTIVDDGIQPPYDLIELFAKSVIHIQDWDRVSVYKDGERGRHLLYCYRRHIEGGPWSASDFDWIRCEGCEKNVCPYCANEADRVFSWKSIKSGLWDQRIIPELSAEELERYGDLSLDFYYPDTVHIPMATAPGDEIKVHFELEVARQQIELLRLLIPRVREKRYALRTAATAIMGRNMSHNIGSHVLARYSTKIKDDTASCEKKADHRGAFLAYLQRRMDFIAEIATSDQSFWFQPLSLKEQIDRLNYEKEEERYAPAAKPILLSYITGKETLKASVKYETSDGDRDIWFSCPGGEIGVHALFVILENVIRNSARHGGDGDDRGGRVELIVCLDEARSSEDLLKIEIIDRRSPIVDVGDRDNPGSTKKLHESINHILNNEPLLDPTGNPKPRDWGVREMQICAHYLRGFALSDLEGRPATPPVLEAGMHSEIGWSCLKYTLYLERAKLMAVIVKDDSKYEKRARELRRKGILVARAPSDNDSSERVGASVNFKGYSFLLRESEGNLDEARSESGTAALPVRTLNCSRQRIDDLISRALTEEEGLAWMEPLHRQWAEQIQKEHEAWRDRRLWGVAVEGGEALKTLDGREPEISLCHGQQDGLFRVRKGSDQGAILPLPDAAETWWDTLGAEAAAAAWVDHMGHLDISSNGARLEHAYKSVRRNRRSWISVEGAYSDSPHSVYLNSAPDGGGWEIIAAALPRVAVLDERVQSELDTNVRGIALSTIWPCMGVWVPARDPCNLDAPTFETCHQFLTAPTNHIEQLPIEQLPIDFLIIHLTILERLARDKALERLARDKALLVSRTLTELVSGTHAARAETIVVSGRGVPKVARALGEDEDHPIEGIRFLPISALLESLVLRPSKLTLMRAIWSAGRPGGATHS